MSTGFKQRAASWVCLNSLDEEVSSIAKTLPSSYITDGSDDAIPEISIDDDDDISSLRKKLDDLRNHSRDLIVKEWAKIEALESAGMEYDKKIDELEERLYQFEHPESSNNSQEQTTNPNAKMTRRSSAQILEPMIEEEDEDEDEDECYTPAAHPAHTAPQKTTNNPGRRHTSFNIGRGLVNILRIDLNTEISTGATPESTEKPVEKAPLKNLLQKSQNATKNFVARGLSHRAGPVRQANNLNKQKKGAQNRRKVDAPMETQSLPHLTGADPLKESVMYELNNKLANSERVYHEIAELVENQNERLCNLQNQMKELQQKQQDKIKNDELIAAVNRGMQHLEAEKVNDVDEKSKKKRAAKLEKTCKALEQELEKVRVQERDLAAEWARVTTSMNQAANESDASATAEEKYLPLLKELTAEKKSIENILMNRKDVVAGTIHKIRQVLDDAGDEELADVVDAKLTRLLTSLQIKEEQMAETLLGYLMEEREIREELKNMTEIKRKLNSSFLDVRRLDRKIDEIMDTLESKWDNQRKEDQDVETEERIGDRVLLQGLRESFVQLGADLEEKVTVDATKRKDLLSQSHSIQREIKKRLQDTKTDLFRQFDKLHDNEHTPPDSITKDIKEANIEKTQTIDMMNGLLSSPSSSPATTKTDEDTRVKQKAPRQNKPSITAPPKRTLRKQRRGDGRDGADASNTDEKIMSILNKFDRRRSRKVN